MRGLVLQEKFWSHIVTIAVTHQRILCVLNSQAVHPHEIPSSNERMVSCCKMLPVSSIFANTANGAEVDFFLPPAEWKQTLRCFHCHTHRSFKCYDLLANFLLACFRPFYLAYLSAICNGILSGITCFLSLSDSFLHASGREQLGWILED